MKRILFLLACTVIVQSTTAQTAPTAASSARPAAYAFTGRIEYERKTNLHRQMEGEEWYQQFISMVPKFYTTYFDLFFNQTKTLYKPGREVETPNAFGARMAGPAASNTVYTDLSQSRVTAGKEIFEDKFLVEDSLRKTSWKILEEVRTVAGYSCRKAVTRMFDSVVVVAFYTDAIPVSGGPEGFAGLPGMILEVAIPRLYTTWIATKVELTPPDAANLTAPTKGKKTTTNGLVQTLQASLKDWGKHAVRNVWWSVI